MLIRVNIPLKILTITHGVPTLYFVPIVGWCISNCDPRNRHLRKESATQGVDIMSLILSHLQQAISETFCQFGNWIQFMEFAPWKCHCISFIINPTGFEMIKCSRLVGEGTVQMDLYRNVINLEMVHWPFGIFTLVGLICRVRKVNWRDTELSIFATLTFMFGAYEPELRTN